MGGGRMSFPKLTTEATLQVDDKTRLDGSASFAEAGSSITKYEFEPDTGDGFTDVGTTKYMDHAYSTAGSKTPSVRITTGAGTATYTGSITVLSAADDGLFSNDQDIKIHEPDILKWVQAGRNSFLDVHRRSQDRIVSWFADNKIFDNDGDRLTKDAFTNIEEFRQWSTFMTLRLIFEGLSNDVGDIFAEKAMRYERLEVRARNTATVLIDFDGDGTATRDERLEIRSTPLLRR
jgi:hypothetical protein